jgi:aryl carrier-like protein
VAKLSTDMLVKSDDIRIDSIEKGLGSEGLSVCSPVEDMLIKFWGQVLVEQAAIGPEDHFVVLGGDSIKAIRLVAVAKRAGFAITVAAILKHPVLRDMARYLKPNGSDISWFPSKRPFGGVASEYYNLRSAVAGKLELAETDIERTSPLRHSRSILWKCASQRLEWLSSSSNTLSYPRWTLTGFVGPGTWSARLSQI